MRRPCGRPPPGRCRARCRRPVARRTAHVRVRPPPCPSGDCAARDRRRVAGVPRASARGSRTGTSDPGDAGVDDLAAAADVGGDDREPHRGRFHRRAGEPLAVGGEHEHVHRRVERVDVVALAEEHARRGPRARSRTRGAERVGLVGVVAADHDEAVAVVGAVRTRRTARGSPSPRPAGRPIPTTTVVVGRRRARARIARRSLGAEAARDRSGSRSTPLPRSAAWRVRCSRCISARSSGFWNSSASEQRDAIASSP